MCIDSMIGFFSSCFSCCESNEDRRVKASSQRQATSAIAQNTLPEAVTIHIQVKNRGSKEQQGVQFQERQIKPNSLKIPNYLKIDSNLPFFYLGENRFSFYNSSTSNNIFYAANLDLSETSKAPLTTSSDDEELLLFQNEQLINLLKASESESVSLRRDSFSLDDSNASSMCDLPPSLNIESSLLKVRSMSTISRRSSLSSNDSDVGKSIYQRTPSPSKRSPLKTVSSMPTICRKGTIDCPYRCIDPYQRIPSSHKSSRPIAGLIEPDISFYYTEPLDLGSSFADQDSLVEERSLNKVESAPTKFYNQFQFEEEIVS